MGVGRWRAVEALEAGWMVVGVGIFGSGWRGVISDRGESRLLSSLLLNTMAAASSHVGSGGIFGLHLSVIGVSGEPHPSLSSLLS